MKRLFNQWAWLLGMLSQAIFAFSLENRIARDNKGTTPPEPYVVGSLLGQLGNKLFEIATAKSVAWDHGVEAYFPELGDKADFRHILFRCKRKPPSNRIDYGASGNNFGYTPIEYHPYMKISGYCQNEKYFAHHRNKIIKLFSPNTKDRNYIKKKYGHILSHPNTVSVHLRYYYAEKPGENSFRQYDREYFEKAMELFPSYSLFVVTSDNMEFAKKNIPTNRGTVLFIEKEPYYIDFFLQSMCKHNIISNSSFSWWSAWLNKNPHKRVVRPKIWLGGFPDIGGPDDWIRIDALSMQERMKNSRSPHITAASEL